MNDDPTPERDPEQVDTDENVSGDAGENAGAPPDAASLADELDFELLDYAVDARVATITIRREAALNALNAQLLVELGVALELAEADVGVGALIVTGAGRAFAAGADIAEFTAIADAFNGREHALAGQDLMNALAAMPIPTIAAINGFALGGGLELALACDLRVIDRDAKIGLPEVGLGVIPGYGGTQRLPRLVGQGRALDLILTGRHVGAEEAYAMGLVTRVADDAYAAALELAQQTLRNAPVALGLAKEAISRGLDVTLPQGLEIEADLFGLATTTDDMNEGAAAFLEKRRADFEGK